MHPLSDISGYESSSEEPGEAGNPKSSSKTKQFYKELIVKANSVPLVHIFKYYSLGLSEQNRKINCPFSTRHKNGSDRTPSFEFFPHTNTFYCYGCKAGSRGCNLVASIENISVSQAAYKILELYESEAIFDGDFDYKIDYSERLEILIDFSDFIRELLQYHMNNKKHIDFIEFAVRAFDEACAIHKIDNANLKLFIITVKTRIKNKWQSQ